MKSIADIMAIRDAMQSQIILRDNANADNEIHIIVEMGTEGLAAGAREVFNALVDEIEERQLKGVRVTRTGKFSEETKKPAVEVRIPGKKPELHQALTAKKAVEILESIAPKTAK